MIAPLHSLFNYRNQYETVARLGLEPWTSAIPYGGAAPAKLLLGAAEPLSIGLLLTTFPAPTCQPRTLPAGRARPKGNHMQPSRCFALGLEISREEWVLQVFCPTGLVSIASYQSFSLCPSSPHPFIPSPNQSSLNLPRVPS